MAAALVVLALGCRTLRFALGLKRGEFALLADDAAALQRRRRGRSAAASPAALPRAPGARPPPARRRLTPQAVVDAIPLATFADVGGGGGGDDQNDGAPSCAVCLSDFAPPDTVRVLRCGHTFHPPCIDAWLTRRDDCCPLCKAPVVAEAEEAQGARRDVNGAGAGAGAGGGA